MSDFKVHNSFEEALEQFKAENPDCKVTVFSGNPQEMIDGLELKVYPVPVDTSIPKYLIKIGKEEHILSLLKQGVVYMNPLSYRILKRLGMDVLTLMKGHINSTNQQNVYR